MNSLRHQRKAEKADQADGIRRPSMRLRLVGAPVAGTGQAQTDKPIRQDLLTDPERQINLAVGPVENWVDADDRHWPRLSTVRLDRASDLEKIINEQRTELSSRYIQIADLCNLQQQQAASLETAQSTIESLEKSIVLLQNALTAQEKQAVAARHALEISNKENIALKNKIKTLENDSADQHRELEHFKAAYNQSVVDIKLAEQKIASLTADLSSEMKDNGRLAAAIEEASQRHHDELKKERSQFAFEASELKAIVADKNGHLKDSEDANAHLVERCNALTQTISALEAAKRTAEETLTCQVGRIELLETLLRVASEFTEPAIKELTTKLANTAQQQAAERLAPITRKDVLILLSKLTTLSYSRGEHVLSLSNSKGQAA